VMTRPWGLLAGALLWPTLGAAQVAVPTPPGQPEKGPGGAEYAHARVEQGHFGNGDTEYWAFTPADPRPRSAPVTVFCHGWLAMQPYVYEAWIAHLVRRGSIVIYPRYQTGARTPARFFTDNAAAAVKDALVRLKGMGPVRPEPERLAVVGHSAGGVIAANLAASWEPLGLPRPRAVMCVEPARSPQGDELWGVPLADYGAIAADTLLLCLAGADDRLAGAKLAEQIIKGAALVPPANKSLLIAPTDRHGAPELVADHTFPTSRLRSSVSLNALDWYACWKLYDGLTDAAFSGKNREYALGNTPQQRFMGFWSDGTPVKELSVP